MSLTRNNPGVTLRSQLYKKSPSTQHIREALRKRFQERLKSTRNTQQCRNRNFYNNIVSEVQKQFVTTEGIEEFNTEEMFELLLKVEQEIRDEALQRLERGAEEYESLEQQEINFLLQNTCHICEQPVQSPSNSDNVVFCSNCVNLHFSTENL
ncbi:hypothetical protein ILUMI_04605 [Ignelater luminosus]|uniref:RPA-interacting protein n=1 Tax=Ignelater luminosus TaxID=2038154 RepID=A0A8K0GJF3_IGNLU|nr:hypothetical protein ILUMI_04605 [Ignelater luminosus]